MAGWDLSPRATDNRRQLRESGVFIGWKFSTGLLEMRLYVLHRLYVSLYFYFLNCVYTYKFVNNLWRGIKIWNDSIYNFFFFIIQFWGFFFFLKAGDVERIYFWISHGFFFLPAPARTASRWSLARASVHVCIKWRARGPPFFLKQGRAAYLNSYRNIVQIVFNITAERSVYFFAWFTGFFFLSFLLINDFSIF